MLYYIFFQQYYTYKGVAGAGWLYILNICHDIEPLEPRVVYMINQI